MNKRVWCSVAMILGLAVLFAAWPTTRPDAQQPPRAAVALDPDEISTVNEHTTLTAGITSVSQRGPFSERQIALLETFAD